MKSFDKAGHPHASSVVHLLIMILIAMVGCTPDGPTVGATHDPPTQFDDNVGVWVRSNEAPTDDDNRRIAKFFEKNPELMGSPEWDGEPNKYVNKDSDKKTRFYWFGGTVENPTWNALEFIGSRRRDFSGSGYPGTENQSTSTQN